MIKISIADYFTKQKLKINKNGAIPTTSEIAPPPKPGTKNDIQFYSAVLGSAGANSGLISQNVDGSTTPQEFFINSHDDFDIHIMQIAIIVADNAVTHNKFGAVPKLTNGWDLVISESGTKTFIVNKAKTGGELIAQSGFSKPFGGGGNAFELINWSGSSDAQIINIPMNEWLPSGLRLGRGTKDKIYAIVNDNLSSLQEFTVRAFGYKNMVAE